MTAKRHDNTMNLELFSAFLLITVVLFLTPGPIVTLILATGARNGTRAALLTVAGASSGNAVLLACIAFGLGWILKTSSDVFDVLRFVGAGYLVWLGIQAWRHAGAASEAVPAFDSIRCIGRASPSPARRCWSASR